MNKFLAAMNHVNPEDVKLPELSQVGTKRSIPSLRKNGKVSPFIPMVDGEVKVSFSIVGEEYEHTFKSRPDVWLFSAHCFEGEYYPTVSGKTFDDFISHIYIEALGEDANFIRYVDCLAFEDIEQAIEKGEPMVHTSMGTFCIKYPKAPTNVAELKRRMNLVKRP